MEARNECRLTPGCGVLEPDCSTALSSSGTSGYKMATFFPVLVWMPWAYLIASLVFAPAMSPARSICPGDDAHRSFLETTRVDGATADAEISPWWVAHLSGQVAEFHIHQDLAVLDGRDRRVLGLL